MLYSRFPTSAGSPAMSIAIESSDELDQLKQLRTRLRKMSDDEMMRFGRAARTLCWDPRCPDTSSSNWKRRVASGGEGTRPKAEMAVAGLIPCRIRKAEPRESGRG